MTMTNNASVGATISSVTGGARGNPLVRSVLRRLSLGMLFILILLFVIFSVLKQNAFLGTYNLRSIALSASVVGVMAIGHTFVLATGGIDLSVGSVLVFGTVVSAKMMSGMGGLTSGWGAVAVGTVVCIVASAFWGLVNGILVSMLRVPPLIATLGSLGMALGAAQIITSGLDIRSVPSIMSERIGYQSIAGVPILVIIAVVVAAVAGLVLWQTGFGVHTKAIGSNPDGAIRSGLSVRKHLLAIYSLKRSPRGRGRGYESG